MCRWREAGFPPAATPARRPQAFAGTDRQVRGRLMAVLRAADEPVERTALDEVWHLSEQRDRALAGLAADGLVTELPGGRWCLPGVATGTAG
jgi:A/G-specific adenine glycosylase